MEVKSEHYRKSSFFFVYVCACVCGKVVFSLFRNIFKRCIQKKKKMNTNLSKLGNSVISADGHLLSGWWCYLSVVGGGGASPSLPPSRTIRSTVTPLRLSPLITTSRPSHHHHHGHSLIITITISPTNSAPPEFTPTQLKTLSLSCPQPVEPEAGDPSCPGMIKCRH